VGKRWHRRATPALGNCPTAPDASNTFLWRSEPACRNPGENTKGVGWKAVAAQNDHDGKGVKLRNVRTRLAS
jgi:hypothetical protein